MNINLPDEVKTAIDILNSHGFEAYAVGGCVRDSLMNNIPSDWDITTSAMPEKMEPVFSDFKVIETGIKHGTLTVIINHMHLEITTFRIDGEYSDNRRPDSVVFTDDIREDLSRRDFTINAIAYSPEKGIVDPFDGISDIKNKVIRCVGDADKRFNEDALRILRALRFASALGFDIEESTAQSINKNSPLLKNIAMERITSEFLKLLCGDNVLKILLNYPNVIEQFIPEIEPMIGFQQNNKHHIYDVWEHTVHAVNIAVNEPDIRLALLLHDIGKPHCYTEDDKGVGHFYGHAEISAKISQDILKRLKLDKDTQDLIYTLVKYHDYPITTDKKTIKRRLNMLSEPVIRKLLLVKCGDVLSHNPAYIDYTDYFTVINSIIDEIINENECFKVSNLAINGNDLINLGVPQNEKMGEILDKLLDAVIDEEVKNEKDELLVLAKKLL